MCDRPQRNVSGEDGPTRVELAGKCRTQTHRQVDWTPRQKKFQWTLSDGFLYLYAVEAGQAERFRAH